MDLSLFVHTWLHDSWLQVHGYVVSWYMVGRHGSMVMLYILVLGYETGLLSRAPGSVARAGRRVSPSEENPLWQTFAMYLVCVNVCPKPICLTPLGLGSSQPASRAARARAEIVTTKMGPHSIRGAFLRLKRGFLCRSAALS